MDSKYLIIFFAMISCSSSAGMLRKTPKVYNALITTDDNLQSSRAFPVIQPTIHETGIAHYPFSPFNPYRFYSPQLYHTAPQGFPIGSQGFPPTGQQNFPTGPQGYTTTAQNFPNEQHGFPTGPQGFPSMTGPQDFPSMSAPEEQSGIPPQFPPQRHPQYPQNHPGYHPQGHPQGHLQGHSQFPPSQLGFHPQGHFPFQQAPLPPQGPPPNPEQNQPNDFITTSGPPDQTETKQNAEPKQDQLPVLPARERPMPSQPQPQIPLNEFGLPPSLIPLHSYQHQSEHYPQNHINLQPYPYNNYPLAYDQFNQFSTPHHQDHYLPPYGYYPSHNFGLHKSPRPTIQNNEPITSPIPSATPTPKTTPTDITASTDEITQQQQTPEGISATTLGEFVKNGVENKNNNVPDVPPPPLPSGAKNN